MGVRSRVAGLAVAAVGLLGVEEGCTIPTLHSWNDARCVDPIVAGRGTSRVLIAYCEGFGDPVAEPDTTRFEVLDAAYAEIELTPSGRPFLSLLSDAPVDVEQTILIRKLRCTGPGTSAPCSVLAQAQSTLVIPDRSISDRLRRNLRVEIEGGGAAVGGAGCGESAGGEDGCGLLDCVPGGPPCHVSQVYRTVVGLVGFPDPGFACTGWSCDDGSSSTTCELGVRVRNEETVCTATFEPDPGLHRLDLDVNPTPYGSPDGYGTVSVEDASGSELCPVGAAGATACRVAAPPGTTLTAIATPLDPIYRFDRWEGDCAPEEGPSDRKPTLPVTLDAPVTDCRAAFVAVCRGRQLQPGFLVDRILYDRFPEPSGGLPGVYAPPDPSALELLASVQGPAAGVSGVVHWWEFRPFDALEPQPWEPLPQCPLAEPRCLLDGTSLFVDGNPVSFAQFRLRVSACRGEIEQVVGPTRAPSGAGAWVDLSP